MLLCLIASCQTNPIVIEEPVVEHVLAPLPMYPDITFAYFTKEEYRANFESMRGYCEQLENWIVIEHPELIAE